MPDQYVTLKDINSKYCTFKPHELYEQLAENSTTIFGLSLDMLAELRRFCNLYRIGNRNDLKNFIDEYMRR